MAVTSAAGRGRPRRWLAGLAWVLWALVMLGLAMVPWMDRLLIRAGRPDLTQLVPGSIVGPVVAVLSAATVGAVLASRRPRHPVGWLLLGFALSLTAAGVITSYVIYGLLARPGALPAAHAVARYYPATGAAALGLLSLVLLLTPTGSLPSARWRWWAWVTAATPVALVLVVPVVPGRLDPQLLVASSPFSDRALGGVLLVATRVALAVTALAVAVAAGSLVVRFRRAQGVERQQLRWVALAAALMVLAVPVVLAPVALEGPILVDWAPAVWVVVLPVAVGAAVLRYRLYDLDRIISRTVAYGLLTLLLGGGYAVVVLGLGQLLERESPLVVAAATLAVAAVFQPARRRVQAVVDRRFNRRRHDTTRIVEGFGARLRDQVDLDTLTADLLAVVDQTMQPTQTSLWLRPPREPPRTPPRAIASP
ncbi:MAG TPA: hypothetical protein VHS79_23470 [Actinomycetes bacterium]|nr:hypothetical protein [Actinomycetes bacterium]